MRRISLPAIVVLVVVSALIGGVSGVLASHNFTDVGSGHPFHDEISAVADAGIALGFEDNTYRPGNPVLRQSMAAFLERGVGRVGEGTGTSDLVPGWVDVVAEVTIEAGAAGSGAGFVVVQGNATASTFDESMCPCPVWLGIAGSTNSAVLQIPPTPNISGYATDAGSVSAVFPLDSDTTLTFRLVAQAFASMTGVPSIHLEGHVTALYVPLAGDGDDTIAHELRCPQDDGYEQNDDRSQATSHFSDSYTLGYGIVCPDDEDWFSLGTVSSNEVISAQVNFDNSIGNIELCVINVSGSDTVCSQTSNSGETVVMSPTSSGDYFVWLYMLSDDAVPGNHYSLETSVYPE